MWDNYYDKVSYEQKTTELDSAGYDLYLPPRIIDVRYVAGGNQFDINSEDTGLKYTKKYHIPFMVNEGDKIDNRLVVEVEPSRDVFGNLHYCIVKVE